MSTHDSSLATTLDRLVPERVVRGDWDAIVRAASRRARRRRLVALGVAVGALAIGVSPVGGAIADGVGDFSAWLRGTPGTPASDADQEAFEQANRRSWAGFPPGTKLRRLISATVAGHEVDLFGFRTGDTLCLRIVGRGLNGSPASSCAPLAALENASTPVVVIQADHAMGFANRVPPNGEPVPAVTQATFGIVADGVEAVELAADDGTHRATVASNAFLYVAERPAVGTRVRRVFAMGADGRRIKVPFESAPFGTWDWPAPSHDRATGPSLVERKVEGGEIGWVFRREQRGEAPPADARYLHTPMLHNVEFARLVTPDPDSSMRMLVAVAPAPAEARRPGQRFLCAFLVSENGAGGGCTLLDDPFSVAPFWLGESVAEGGDQYATLSGLASDDVARLELYLATGESRPIPLHDNAWAIQAARADRPYRVVAYDHEGRIIGIQDMGDKDALAPRPAGDWRTLLTARDSRGQVGEVHVAPSGDGGQCYEIRLPGGAGSSGCTPKSVPAGTPELLLDIQPAQGSAWVTGQVADEVTTIDVVFDDGHVETVTPKQGFVLHPLALGTTPDRNAVATIVGRDTSRRQSRSTGPGGRDDSASGAR
jgi:hypothetical protein